MNVYIIEACKVIEEDHIEDVVLKDYETGCPLLFETKEKAEQYMENIRNSTIYRTMTLSECHDAMSDLHLKYSLGELSNKEYCDILSLYYKTMTELRIYRANIHGYHIKTLKVF